MEDENARTNDGYCGFLIIPKEIIDIILLELLPPYMRAVCCFVCKDWKDKHIKPPSSNHGLPKFAFAEAAARAGDLNILKWGIAQGCAWDGHEVFVEGSRSGNVAILEWVLANGGKWSAWGLEAAAGAGHIESLEFLRDYGIRRCHTDYLDPNVLKEEGESLAGGAPASHDSELVTEIRRLTKKVPWLVMQPALTPPLARDAMCVAAASGGHLNVLVWLRENRVDPLSRPGTPQSAALNGRIETLEWLRDNGVTLTSDLCPFAARGGHIETLEWLLNNGCPPTISACCEEAAGRGHVEVLKWLRERACPLSEACCAQAALKGDLAMLQELRAMGCPWDKSACYTAVVGDHLDVFLWLREQRCPPDVSMARGKIATWLQTNDPTLYHSQRQSTGAFCWRIIKWLVGLIVIVLIIVKLMSYDTSDPFLDYV